MKKALSDVYVYLIVLANKGLAGSNWSASIHPQICVAFGLDHLFEDIQHLRGVKGEGITATLWMAQTRMRIAQLKENLEICV